jgi:hypothetical protein
MIATSCVYTTTGIPLARPIMVPITVPTLLVGVRHPA